MNSIYEAFLRCTSVTTDSRNVPVGSLFFALKGDRFNGNLYAEEALRQGASYAVVDEGDYADHPQIFRVENVLQTLQELANLHRRTLGTPIIAITGSNGKTTTKELMAAVLSKSHHLLFTQGNLNNHIGVPLTLLRLKPEHTLAVVEMGANHPGEIKQLAEIAEPNWGVITNVGKAHLEGFGSLEGVIQTKTELYRFLRASGGSIFLHAENGYLVPHAEGLNVVCYGTSKGLFVSGHTLPTEGFMRVLWQHQNTSYEINTRLIGDYNLTNALVAITAGLIFNVPAEKINEALSEYEPTNNRSMMKETATNRLIIDAYNANPSSMQAALNNFATLQSEQPKALLLGEMREMGNESADEHRKVIDTLRQLGLNEVYLCGAEYEAIDHTPYAAFATVDQLNEHLQKHPLRNHLILIKGSRGTTMERTIEYL